MSCERTKSSRENGRTAEGPWVKGQQHGSFKLVVPKEGIFVCNFENGKPSESGEVKPYVTPKKPEKIPANTTQEQPAKP